jgi:hypothetical protein
VADETSRRIVVENGGVGRLFRTQRVRSPTGSKAFLTFAEIALDLGDAFGAGEFLERLAIAPCERRPVVDGVLFVALGLFERIWMLPE